MRYVSENIEMRGVEMAKVDTVSPKQPIVVNNRPPEALTEHPNEDVTSTITEQMEMLSPSYNERNAERPLLLDSPVFVSGSLPLEDETVKALGDAIGRPVIPSNPTKFKYPEGFQPLTYLINLGLAMKAV